MNNTNKEKQAVLIAVQGIRAPACNEEYDIHRMVQQAREQAGLLFRHEATLAPGCRIDFLVGRTGIEIKKSRPDRKRLIQQLHRYLESDMLDSVIVISERTVSLPAKLLGKEVTEVSLSRLWGVALP